MRRFPASGTASTRQAGRCDLETEKYNQWRREDDGSPSGKQRATGQRGVGAIKGLVKRVPEEARLLLASTGRSLRKKTSPRGPAAKGWSLTLARGGGAERPGVTKAKRGGGGGDAHPDAAAHDHSVQVRPHAAHGRRPRTGHRPLGPAPRKDTAQPRAGGKGPSSLGAGVCSPDPETWKAVWGISPSRAQVSASSPARNMLCIPS